MSDEYEEPPTPSSTTSTGSKKMRPTSTIARAFSDQLNDAFLIDESLDQLESTIHQKKQSVSYKSAELSQLEARLRQTEELLKERQKRLSTPYHPPSPVSNGTTSNSMVPPVPRSRPFPSAPTVPVAPEEEEEEEEDEEEEDARGPRNAGGFRSGAPGRAPPPPPVPSGMRDYVVVEKTPSIMGERPGEAAAGTRDQYPARPPPPVPSGF